MLDPNDERWNQNIPDNARVIGIVTHPEYGCTQFAQSVDSYGRAGDYYSRTTPKAPFRFYCTKGTWPTSPAARALAAQAGLEK